MRSNSRLLLLLVIACSATLSVLFLPAAHIGKRLVSNDTFYDAFQAQEILARNVGADEFVLIDSDELLPPVLKRFVEPHLQGGRHQVFWVFPVSIFLSIEQKRRLTNWLVCFLSKQESKPFVWGAGLGLALMQKITDRRVRIEIRDVQFEADIVDNIVSYRGVELLRISVDKLLLVRKGEPPVEIDAKAGRERCVEK